MGSGRMGAGRRPTQRALLPRMGAGRMGAGPHPDAMDGGGVTFNATDVGQGPCALPRMRGTSRMGTSRMGTGRMGAGRRPTQWTVLPRMGAGRRPDVMGGGGATFNATDVGQGPCALPRMRGTSRMGTSRMGTGRMGAGRRPTQWTVLPRMGAGRRPTQWTVLPRMGAGRMGTGPHPYAMDGGGAMPTWLENNARSRAPRAPSNCVKAWFCLASPFQIRRRQLCSL